MLSTAVVICAGFSKQASALVCRCSTIWLRPAMSILVKDTVPNVIARSMQLIAAEIVEDLQVALEQSSGK